MVSFSEVYEALPKDLFLIVVSYARLFRIKHRDIIARLETMYDRRQKHKRKRRKAFFKSPYAYGAYDRALERFMTSAFLHGF